MYKLATNTKQGSRYSEDIRTFAMGMHYHSPAAYEFAKEKLSSGDDLPHKSTIAQWYNVVDCSPGISAAALEIVSNKVKAMNEKGKPLFANLVMDEMSIRKQLFTEADGTIGGCTNVGFDIGLKQELATEALVFLVTAINDHFKVPISHHFTAGIAAEQKNILITQVLMALHDQNLIVPSITFDGMKTNIRCMKLLGASFDEPITPTFPHPCGTGSVCVIMDAVHMLKLVRNTFAAKGVLQDCLGRDINFDF